MTDARQDLSSECPSGERVAKAGWGLLSIWTGAALLMGVDWGTGLIGAGLIVLAAQAARRYLGVRLDGFGLVAGLLLLACGVWTLFDIRIRVVPLLFIGAGIALLLSTWTSRRPTQAPPPPTDLHAASGPRA